MEKSTKKHIVILGAYVVVFAVVVGGGYVCWNHFASKNVKSDSSQIKNDQAQRRGAMDTSSIEASITEAVTAGTLTSRQGELLIAELENVLGARSDQSQMPQNFRNATSPSVLPSGTPPTMPEGRDQSEVLQQTVDALNDKGLNTTVEELTEAKTAAEKAGITLLGSNRGGNVPNRNGVQPTSSAETTLTD